MIRTLALFALVVPAFGQFEGAAATRKQKLLLEPLVQATCMRLELHLPSFTADELEGRVEKALYNQASRVVEKRYKELVIDLLIEDLGVSKRDARAVQYGPYETFGRSLPAWNSSLMEFSGRSWAARDKDAYLVTGAVADHQFVLRRDPDTQYRLKLWVGREPSKDQGRGLEELSAYWAGRLEHEFGFERKNKDFHNLLESVFVSLDTERAVMGTLCKLRFLVRPEIRDGLEADEFEAILAAEDSVTDRIERELIDAEWWPQLEADHRAMVEDPKTQRDVIRARLKAEKAARKKDDGG